MNKKVNVVNLSPPWFIQVFIWVIEAFSYRVRVKSERVKQKVIECPVTLSNGQEGLAYFSDYLEIDASTGELSMHTTALKTYQAVGERGMIIVKFPKESADDWAPVHFKDISFWGKPVTSTRDYPFKVEAVKFLGITLRYELTKE